MTVVEPVTIVPGPPGTQLTNEQGAEVSVTRAAGWLPISTDGAPVTMA